MKTLQKKRSKRLEFFLKIVFEKAEIMQTPNIVPLKVFDYNNTNLPRNATLVSKALPSGMIVSKADEYEVRPTKMFCPVNGEGVMPIDNNADGYYINLFCDVKSPPDPPIPGLEYLNNIFKIEGPIYSVQDLLGKINGVFAPFNLGSFSIRPDELIEFKTITQLPHTQIFMYLDVRLADKLLMTYNPFSEFELNGVRYTEFGWKYKVEPVHPHTEVQKKFTQNRFYTIKNVIVRTSLETYYIESGPRDAYYSDLLHEITYNANSMSESIDLIFSPQDRIMRSLTSTAPIYRVEARLYYQYQDSQELPVVLLPGQYAQITLEFERIHKI
jgi:hypothetical protein